jgi:hypothetical protein
MSNPYQCPRCGAMMRDPATDLPSALFALQDLSDVGRQKLKSEYESGIVELEDWLGEQGESREEGQDRA